MKRLSLLFAMLMAFAMTATAMAGTLEEIQKRGKLRIGMEPGYMPFELQNKKGEIIGFDADMGAVMAKAMGVELELVSTAWDGIIPALLTGKFDIIMSGMTLTQERNMSINFAPPYVVIGQTILVKKDLAGTIKTYKDLNDPKYTVASKLGTTGEQATKRMIPKAKYNSYETEQEGVMELVNGKIVHLDTPFTFEPISWGVRKGDADFLNWLENFMYQVKNDGTYERIYHKWFQDDAWLKEIQ